MAQSRRLRKDEKGKVVANAEVDRQSKHRLNLSPGTEKLLAGFFLVATLTGLALALWLALAYPLTSDMANAGLFPMEVMRGNFEYVLPANNPYFFTDYIFHMVVQPLTGYSRDALVLTGYAMYVSIVLACAAIAWRLAGRVEALAAAALVANIPFTGLLFVLYPLYHNGTILFILLSILAFYADRPPVSLSVRWRALIIGALQLLGVFSDSLMLPLFTIPLLVYSAYRLLQQAKTKDRATEGQRSEGSPVIWLATTVPALAAFAAKPFIGQLWPGGPILATTAADLGSAGNLLSHPEMVELYIGGLIQNAGGWIIALVILLAIGYVILDRKDRLLHSVLAIGALVMLLGFMSMTMAGDPARYLTPISILALVAAATVTLRKGVAYLPLIAVSAIVLFWVWTNAATVLENPTPDYVKNQQALVNLLESKNITHAYADYWDANVNTYLSGGRVTVEPVYLDNDRLKFQYMNSAPGWTSTWPDGNDTRPVLITTTDSSLDTWARTISENHPPEAVYEYANGRVYVYNGTLPAWPAGE